MHSPTFTSCYCARVLKVFRFWSWPSTEGRGVRMTNEVIDIYFPASTKNQQQKVRLPFNCLFSFCAKNATTTFSSSCEMMNLWRRGRRLIKHFLSIQFPLVRANVAWNLLFFWKIMHGLKRCPKLPCVFLKMDELEENDVRGICLLHTFEGIEGH